MKDDTTNEMTYEEWKAKSDRENDIGMKKLIAGIFLAQLVVWLLAGG
jgi:hypothetical protein